ncbi:hypothetical protein K457DRAFT_1887481 [Linnemannia elongata AG-77]|uniref:Ubiquitin-domain-containing protein n=1 Tax=Linnemannia elongata AG-77 TaxID=1314771 RepID=A0A197JBA3_9FUNG|nr:hypothetical protein K457DRAFT_1887481 [Linnemannia elongata AG-77]
MPNYTPRPPSNKPTTLHIINANGGPEETIAVPYIPNESISALLKRIQTTFSSNGSMSNIREDLYLNGKRLKDKSKTLAYHRIFGRTLTYRVLSARSNGRIPFSIQVITPAGKIIPLICHSYTLVEDVKDMIREKEGIADTEQTITYAGMQLVDSHMLQFYRISAGSALHAVLPHLCTVTLPGILYLDNKIGTHMGVRKIRFSRNASRGRVPNIGTNVECECKCTPGPIIIVQKGLGTLELAKATLTCPNCGKSDKIVPVAFGFLKCKYRYHGIQASDGAQFTSDWEEVHADDRYHLVNADIKKAGWRRLVVESAGLHQYDPCTICLEPLRKYEAFVCGHQFHSVCARKWKGFCPNCHNNKHLAFDATTKVKR